MTAPLIVLASGPVLAAMWRVLQRAEPFRPPLWHYPYIIGCAGMFAGWLALGCPV